MQQKHDQADTAESEANAIENSRGVLAPAQQKVQKTDTKKRGRNYILERIAMQQDCVEDSSDQGGSSIAHGKPRDIHRRIAHQMDIPGDHFAA